MTLLLTAISLGFLGSFHCIGMCGPIAFSLPVHNKPPVLKYLLILFYNSGRILTYSFFGFIAGTIGKGFALAGFQQALSIGIGILLLATVFFSSRSTLYSSRFFMQIKTALSKILLKGSRSSLFMIGLLNGFLPCGLVYAGIAGAVATSDALYGTLFMAAFGAGTLPMMILLPLFGNAITGEVRTKIRRAVPLMVSVMAILLILRGLNLGIPYISPKVDKHMQTASCHTVSSSTNPVKLIKCGEQEAH